MDKRQISESENSINEIDKNDEGDDEVSSLPSELEDVFTDIKTLATINLESVAKCLNNFKQNWEDLIKKIDHLEKHVAKNYQPTCKDETSNELKVLNRVYKMQNETLERQNEEYVKMNEINEKKIEQLVIEK